MFILYQLTFQNGKIYIGQTVRSMKIRLLQHRRSVQGGSSLPVHCAWRKHGEPSVSILSRFKDQESLHQAEIEAIRENSCLCPNGYNLSLGGGTAPSKSPEVARKISKKAKGRKIDNRERRSQIAKELWADPDYRRKMSNASKEKWADPEYKAMMSEKRRIAWQKRKDAGWVMPESTKEKMRGKKRSEESKIKMSESAKRRVYKPRSPETKAKIAEATRKAWQNKEVTEKRLSAMRQAFADRKNLEDQQTSTED